MQSGQVIVLPFFPNQEDKTEGQARWAIIIEDLQDAYLIVPMSCQQHQETRYRNTLKIAKDSVDGKEMQLTCNALVIIDRSYELPKIIFKTSILKKGVCPEHVLDEIFEKLK